MNKKYSFGPWCFFKNVVALFVLLLFIAAPLVEIFHHHDELTVQLTDSGQSITKSQAKCKICEHFLHHQTTPFILVASFSLMCFEGNITIVNSPAMQDLMQLSGLSWSNKGPPALG